MSLKVAFSIAYGRKRIDIPLKIKHKYSGLPVAYSFTRD